MSDTKDSFILIKFESFNSAAFGMKVENVSPFQILAVASYLELKAKFQLNQMEIEQLQNQDKNKISVPTGQILTPER